MVNKILSRCKKCGHIEVKKLTIKDRLIYSLILFIKTILTIFVVVGAFFCYNLFLQNSFSLNNTFGSLSAGIFNSLLNFQSSNDNYNLMSIENNIIKGCNNDYCKAENTYNYIRNNYIFRANSSIKMDTDALNLYNLTELDCDTSAYLFMSLIKTQNISSKMECKANLLKWEGHCWTMVNIENKTIKADIAQGRWEEIY
jgi:hypothetical protein